MVKQKINSRAYTDGNGEIEKNPDHRVYYYYFQINGQAYTNGVLKFVHTNGKTYYYYFQSNGQAYTNGYKALNSSAYTDGTTLAQKVKDNKTYYYYFQKMVRPLEMVSCSLSTRMEKPIITIFSRMAKPLQAAIKRLVPDIIPTIKM